MPVPALPLPKSGHINHVCHISDIHIRAGIENNDQSITRFDEYTQVFESIANFLKQTYTQDDLVIVITGDVVHDNRKAGASCIELFNDIISLLTSIAPVYIIRGNHDYNQASIDPQDMLASLLHAYKHSTNIAYLNQTGIYTAGNISFGLVAIQDVLKPGDTNSNSISHDTLPLFPLTNNMEANTTKIALFHGDINKACNIDWIGPGYDFIMLGDLHNMQIGNANPQCELHNTLTCAENIIKLNTYTKIDNNKPIWAYPGSTIQQRFKESLLGHGFLMWDIHQNIVEAFHVINQYGHVDVNYINDECNVDLSFPNNKGGIHKCWTPLGKAVNQSWFPTKLRLCVYKNKEHYVSFQDLCSLFTTHKLEIIRTKASNQDPNDKCDDYVLQDDDINADDFDESIDITHFNQPSAWCDYIKTHVPLSVLSQTNDWQNWFTSPETIMFKQIPCEQTLTVSLVQDIADRNKKIQDALVAYKESYDDVESASYNHTKFQLCYMDWSWILCFADGNHFNFKELKGTVHCIGGKNGFGKTSFLETVCTALYGEGFPSRISKNFSASIICQQRPRDSRAFTSIVFQIDDKSYRIKRIYEIQKENTLNSKDAVLEIYTPEFVSKPWKEIHSGKKATSEWIAKYLGKVESFLTSCIITQAFDEDYFAKNITDQKLYLDKQLRLDSSTTFYRFLKTACLAYEDIAKKVCNICELKKQDITLQNFNPNDLEKTKSDLNSVSNQIQIKKTQRDTLKDVWTVINEPILKQGKKGLQNKLAHAKHQLDACDIGECVTTYTVLENKGKLKKELDEVIQFHDQNILDYEVALKDCMKLQPKTQEPLESVEWITKELLANNEILDTFTNIKTSRDKLKKVQSNLTTLQSKANKTATLLQKEESNLKTLLDDVDGKQALLNKMMDHQPDTPKISIEEHNAWLDDINDFHNKYNSIHELNDLIASHTTPSIHRPTMTQNEVSNAEVRVTKWLLSMQKQFSDIASGHHIKAKLETLNQCLEIVHADLMELQDESTRLLTIKTHAEEQLQDAESKLKTCLEAKPIIPAFLGDPKNRKSTYDTFLKNKKVLDTIKSKTKNIDPRFVNAMVQYYPLLSEQLSNAMKNLQDKQAMLNACEKYEFNPNCKACMLHPWKLKKDDFEKACCDLQSSIADIHSDMVTAFGRVVLAEKNKAEYNKAKDLKIILDKEQLLSDEYAKSKAFWDEQQHIQTTYQDWEKTKESLTSDVMIKKKLIDQYNADIMQLTYRINNCQTQRDEHLKTCDKLSSFLSDWTCDIHDLHMAVTTNKESIAVWDAWDNRHNELVAEQQAWTKLLSMCEYYGKQTTIRAAYDTWNKEWKDVKNNISKLDAQKDKLTKTVELMRNESANIANDIAKNQECIAEINSYLADYDSLCERKKYLDNIMRVRKEWNDWNSQIDNLSKGKTARSLIKAIEDIDSILIKIKKRDAIVNEVSELQAALSVVDAYDEYNAICEETHSLTLHKLQLDVSLKNLENMALRFANAKKETEQLCFVHDDLQHKLSTMKAILVEFASFKDWVLQKQVIPLLIRHVNQLLVIMCKNHRELQLHAVFDNKGMFNWLVKDGDNCPPIEKASGFQRFVLSLAMRIVLGRLGVAGLKNTQLFIDEGFTACDNDNLDNVPSVLKELLNTYDTIVIVSHLDELKQSIPSSINIDRDPLTGLSRICFGKSVHEMEVINKPGRRIKPKLIEAPIRVVLH